MKLNWDTTLTFLFNYWRFLDRIFNSSFILVSVDLRTNKSYKKFVCMFIDSGSIENRVVGKINNRDKRTTFDFWVNGKKFRAIEDLCGLSNGVCDRLKDASMWKMYDVTYEIVVKRLCKESGFSSCLLWLLLFRHNFSSVESLCVSHQRASCSKNLHSRIW